MCEYWYYVTLHEYVKFGSCLSPRPQVAQKMSWRSLKKSWEFFNNFQGGEIGNDLKYKHK